MDSDLITIAIPVHDRADVVQRTLDSIEAQTYRPLRVILVDNASTDGTMDVLCRWRNRVQSADFNVTVISESEPGAPAARNAALDMIDTPWTMFFDSDDTMRPHHVGSVVEAIREHPDADIVGWDLNYVFIDGSETVRPFATKHLVYNCIMHGSFATLRYACRTDIFRQAGGWDNKVTVWNDIELGTRILCKYPYLKVVKIHDGPHVDVYQTAASITGLLYHANGSGREYSMSKMLATLPDDKKDIIGLKMAILAASYYREGYADDADRLVDKALALTTSAIHRMALRLSYHYTRLGLKGITRIVKVLY